MHRPALRAAALAALVVVGVVGCSSGGSQQPTLPTGITAPPPTPVATPEPTVTSTLPAEIAGVDTSGWQQIATPGGTATFRIPPGWSTQPTTGGLAILRPDGERQLAYVEGAPTGDGRCLDGSGTAVAWRTAILDRQGVDLAGVAGSVSFGAAAVQLGDQWVVGMGLLPTERAAAPRCPIVHSVEAAGGTVSFGSETIVTGAGDGEPWAVSSVAAAEEYVGSEEFAALRAILMSLELQE